MSVSRVVLMLAFGLLFSTPAKAQTTYFVNPCGRDDTTSCNGLSSACWSAQAQPNCAKATIQAGMTGATANGDVVIVAPGTYTGTGNRDLTFPVDGSGHARSITVRCATPDYPQNCVIDCQGSNPCSSGASSQHRGFRFDNNYATNDAVVEGFTIKNGCIPSGTNAFGGAIRVDHAAPTIRNCVFENNRANRGGALGFLGSSPELNFLPNIQNCVIRNNQAMVDNGGGIYADTHVDPLIDNCVISGNSAAGKGGGIYHGSGCDPRIDRSVIEGNTAASGGGGIFLSQTKESPDVERPRILRSRIGPNNSTTGSSNGGGGIRIDDIYGANIENVSIWIQDCTIIENHADLSLGGGVSVAGGLFDSSLGLIMANNVIAGNSALSGGGIHVSGYAPLSTTNLTMMHNKALGTSGGAAVFFEGYVESYLRNTVVWHDATSPTQRQVRIGSDTRTFNQLRVWHSDIQDTLPSGVQAAGNISSNPLFADADGFDNNKDTLIDNDYRLQSGSPCNDRGSVLLVLADDLDLDADENTSERIPLDLEEGDRYEDDPAVSNLGVNDLPYYPEYVDIGAYEYSGQCPEASVVSADPPDGTRDARQPHPMSDNSLGARQGIGSANIYPGGPEPIKITLSAGGAANPVCWSLCETGIEPVDEGSPLSANRIVSVTEMSPSEYWIYLARPISSQHWTTLTYLGSGDEVSYASMPGDANHNGNTLNADVLLVNAWVQDGCAGHTVYEWDIDRNGLCQTADAQQINYLMAGTDKFVVWLGKQLSSNTCASDSLMGGQSEEVAFEPWDVVETFVGLVLEGASGWLESETDLENLSEAFLDWADGYLTDEERLSAADYIEESAASTDDETATKSLNAAAAYLRE